MRCSSSFSKYDPDRSAKLKYLIGADDYFQDIEDLIKHEQVNMLLVTGWFLHSSTCLGRKTFGSYVVEAAAKRDIPVYILWNESEVPALGGGTKKTIAYVNEIVDYAGGRNFTKKEKDRFKQNFKVIVSSQRRFDWPDLPLYVDILLWYFDVLENLQIEDIQDGTHRLTLGSHHQKTLISIGAQLITYCGGMDFNLGVAGWRNTSKRSYGRKDWHDVALRVTGLAGTGILENFVERWNSELENLNETELVNVTADDVLEIDQYIESVREWEKWRAPRNESFVKTIRTVPLDGFDVPFFGDTRLVEIREAYLDAIESARKFIYIENQYFRHLEITEAIVDVAKRGVKVKIIVSTQTEELGKEIKDMKRRLKTRYVAKKDIPPHRINPLIKLFLYGRYKALKPIEEAGGKIFAPKAGRPYIHAKMMIVDGERLVVGSANINGRSMDGRADSEINFVVDDKEFVMKLWKRILSRSYASNLELSPYNIDDDDKLSAFPATEQEWSKYWEFHRKRFEKLVGKSLPTWKKINEQIGKNGMETFMSLDLRQILWEAFYHLL